MANLISEHSQLQVAYKATLWAEWFHSAPHVNITFHQVESRFNPQSDVYKESLGLLASVPAAWLITTLVVLLIYLCTRCCDSKNDKRRKSKPIRCCLSFFSLVTVAAVSVGFWGNHLVHEGIVGFERATVNIDNNVKRAQSMANKYNEVFQKDIEQNMNRLYDGPFQRDIRESPASHFEIMESCDVVFHNITSGLTAMDELRFVIDDQDNRIDFRQVIFGVRTMEKYRWPTTMVLQVLFAAFCLLLLIGAVVHSRCVLILFSVFGLFSIIFLWFLASVYTAVGVGLADFCYDPTPWVKHMATGMVKQDVSSYYLECNRMQQSPFGQQLASAERAINDIDRRVRMISGTAREFYRPAELSPYLDNLEKSTEDTVQLVQDLNHSLKCQHIFRSYNTALVSLCDSGLLGLIIMLLSCAVSGILFTTLVWCNSHTWIYFKHKGRYIKVDDTDPYMPLSTIERPRPTVGTASVLGQASASNPYTTARRNNIHTPPRTPPYHGTLNGHNGGLGRGGPPAYSHPPYGHVGGSVTQRAGHHNHAVGTLGRNVVGGHQYQALDTLPATMTLGRRGHYAGLRNTHAYRPGNDEHGAGGPLLGGNGQYATLSKQCKTLESSDFY